MTRPLGAGTFGPWGIATGPWKQLEASRLLLPKSKKSAGFVPKDSVYIGFFSNF